MTPEKNSSIRKEVNKAKSKVAKTIFQVGLATSMIIGAPACVRTEAISIIPTGETASLPASDSTKTPQSPTDAPIEIPSTSGIESTINPPTQLPTEMPTATATATEMPTPTEVAKEKYPIDLEKLVTPPKSFEELKQHPEKFVQSPNPMENFEEFIKWYNETLFEKALGGDLEKLPVNYEVDGISIGSDRVLAYSETEKEVLSVPKFLYFKNGDIYYPTYIVTVYDPKYDNKVTYAILVAGRTREVGGDKTSQIFEGLEGFKELYFLFNISSRFLKDEQLLVDKGFGTINPSTVGEIPIAFGAIYFFD